MSLSQGLNPSFPRFARPRTCCQQGQTRSSTLLSPSRPLVAGARLSSTRHQGLSRPRSAANGPDTHHMQRFRWASRVGTQAVGLVHDSLDVNPHAGCFAITTNRPAPVQRQEGISYAFENHFKYKARASVTQQQQPRAQVQHAHRLESAPAEFCAAHQQARKCQPCKH